VPEGAGFRSRKPTKAKRKKLQSSDMAEVNGYTMDDDVSNITGIPYKMK
jgi:hypothetical protein